MIVTKSKQWTRRSILRAAGAVLAASAWVPWPAIAEAGDDKAALALVREMADKTLAMLRNKSDTRAQREKQVSELYRRYFAIRSIGRFVLGRFWRRATEAQRQDYLNLFEVYAVKMLTDLSTRYADESFEITQALPDGKGFAVSGRVFTTAGKPVEVRFRLRRRRSGALVVVDVLVENLSMSITVRNEFAAVIRKDGGGIEALMDSLRKKIRELDAKKFGS